MADTFDSRLKLRLQESGGNSGQWGTLLNQTVTNIASVFGYGTHQLTSDADATLTLSDDGASIDALKSSYLKITSSVSLTATRTLTFAPNTFNQVKYIENATTGSQSLVIKQGSGATVIVASGKTAVLYFTGSGSDAAVVDALAGVDPGVTDTLAEVLAAGNATGGTDIAVGTGDDVTFADNAKAKFGTDGDLEVFYNGTHSVFKDASSGNIYIQDDNNIVLGSIGGENYLVATKDGAVSLYYDAVAKLATNSGGATLTGSLIADGLIMGDSDTAYFGTDLDLRILHTGTEGQINNNTGNLILDVAGSIKLDADSSNIYLADGGTDIALLSTNNSDLNIRNLIADKDIYFQGSDGGSVITALTLSMQNAGAATFNSSATATSLTTTNSGITLQSSSTTKSAINVAASTNQGINGTAAGDQYNWTTGGKMLWSTNSGVTAHLVLDGSGNVGIGIAPSNKLHVAGNSSTRNTIVSNATLDGGTAVANPYEGFGFGVDFIGRDYGNAVRNYAGIYTLMESKSSSSGGGDVGFKTALSFYTNSGGASNTNPTEAMRIDSSGNVGIGATSLSAPLHVKSSGTGNVFYVESSDGGHLGGFYQESDTRAAFNVRDASGNVKVNLDSGGDSYFTGGNVGIGVTPETDWDARYTALQLNTGGAISSYASGSTFGTAISTNQRTTANTFVAGNKYIASAAAALYLQDNSGQHIWYNAASGTADATISWNEAMRIDSSGNLLVGTTNANPTSSSVNDAGVELSDTGGVRSTVASNPAATFNRKTNDGDIVLFRKDGSTVGSIACNSDTSNAYMIIGKGAVGLQFASDSDADSIMPARPDNQSLRDNAIDLGSANYRFDDIFATNGTIQTSDRNEKQDIEALSEAEQRVAVAAKGLLRKFRWKSAVEENGDDARIHFGIIAQDLQDAFTAEGLDAGRYAMFISSTWTDEETGEERTRLGVRYSELLAFIISAI